MDSNASSLSGGLALLLAPAFQRKVQDLEQEAERAIGSRITVGKDGCVQSVANAGSGAAFRFNSLVSSPYIYQIAFGAGGSRWDPITRSIRLDRNEVTMPFFAVENGACRPGVGTFNHLSRVLAHELGHAYGSNKRFGRLVDWLGGVRRSEYMAMRWENEWARRNNELERCRCGYDF